MSQEQRGARFTQTLEAERDTAELRRQLRHFGNTYRRFRVDLTAAVQSHQSSSPVDGLLDARQRLAKFLDASSYFSDVDRLAKDRLLDLRADLTRLGCQAWLQPYLEQSGIPTPTYNTFAPFDDNVLSPWEPTPPVAEAVTPVQWTLFGLPIRYPIGVPASSLTSSAEWITFYARKGFNVLTFKTVRSSAKAAHPFPNWIFIDDTAAWRSLGDVRPVTAGLETWPRDLRAFSTANSFGVPSTDPGDWQAEVKESLSRLEDGQLLILSVMGDPDAGPALVDDFVRVAELAVQTGVRAIELNLSCPNTLHGPGSVQPPICNDAGSTARIIEAVHRVTAANDVRLVAKLGYLPAEALRELVVSRGVGEAVDAFSGINTVQTEVRGHDGRPTFGTRDKAGISGAAIKPLGIDFCRNLSAIRSANRALNYDIIAMGGVMSVDAVSDYFDVGADAVQSATGAFCNPELAAEVQLRRLALEASATRHDSNRWRIAREVLTSGRFDLLRK